MKKSILFVTVLMVSISSYAQSERYLSAMKANIAAIDTSYKNPQNLLTLANNFERIAMAEKNQWLPYYYAAMCQVNFSYMEQDKSKVDAIADKATSLIIKADSLKPENSEVSCIRSMIAGSQMMVDPMQRFMTYGSESSAQLEKAIQQDSTNPRPHYLKGQGLKYTPEQFGGGCKKALPILETALNKYAAFKPETELSPNWGMKRTEMLLKECK